MSVMEVRNHDGEDFGRLFEVGFNIGIWIYSKGKASS